MRKTEKAKRSAAFQGGFIGNSGFFRTLSGIVKKRGIGIHFNAAGDQEGLTT